MHMDVNETFRENLRSAMARRDKTAPEVALAAGLNRRMVYDILEGRSQSPKIETVVKLAGALNLHPGELLGFGPQFRLHPRLAGLLEQYPEADQERLALALAQLRPLGASGR
jgi:transcriptional regulator with XRE-family HTH domain